MQNTVQSFLRVRIMEQITHLLALGDKIPRKQIVQTCLAFASEPTIQSVISDMLEDGFIDEFSLPPAKGSQGGRPAKVYSLIVKSEKTNHCVVCYRKFWLDPDTNEKIPVNLSPCVDCSKFVCSSCNVVTQKGTLCLRCVNTYYQCPSCEPLDADILIPDEMGLLICQDPRCSAYSVPRDEAAVAQLWRVKMNPNFHEGPRITYSVNLITKDPQADDDKIQCLYCKRRVPEYKIDKHIRKKHNRRWRRDRRKSQVSHSN